MYKIVQIPEMDPEYGRTLEERDARFYALCAEHGIIPPIGPEGPPPQVRLATPEAA